MRRILLSFLFLALLCGAADAACSGSGTTWSCPSGSSAGDIQTAINSSTDGATITMAAGSYSWTSGIEFSSSKATTLICASVGGCTVTGTGIIGENGGCSGDSTKLQRVSGFNFTTGNNPRFWWYGSGPCIRVIRIDHNTFNVTADGTIMFFGENGSTDNYMRGVIDHNTINSSVSSNLLHVLNGNSDGAPTGTLGTDKNLFVEDNTFSVTTIDDTGVGMVDGWGGGALVVRYNTTTNARILMHGVPHVWGPVNFEVYNNSIVMNSGANGSGLADNYRSVHHQGSGTYMVFNNTFTPSPGQGHSADAAVYLHYRSWCADPGTCGIGVVKCDGTVGFDGNRSPSPPNYGYPCKRQPGRDPAAKLLPLYAWNNKFSDNQAKIDLVCNDQGESNPNTCLNHVVVDRDVFNAVGTAQTSPTSPFNGATGMGFGTLANRPTTCSVGGTQAQDAGNGGVGYFATDGTDTGQRRIQLAWAPSTDNVGVAGYKIYRDGSQIGTSATNSFIDDTASPSTSYNYTVSAFDAAGNESAQSAPMHITASPLATGTGVLYRCASPNTWVTHYAPYTYPHPLTLP